MKYISSIAVAVALGVGIFTSVPSFAQLNLNKTQTVAIEPTTQLSSDQWLVFESKFLNLPTLVNQPWLILINATPDTITSLLCDNRADWQFVGQKPYFPVDPVSVPPWSLTPIYIDSTWNGYCADPKTGLTAKGSSVLNKYTAEYENEGNPSTSRYLFILPAKQ